MTRGLTLDAGALIALENRSGRMQALLELAAKEGITLAVPAGVVAQVWRGGPRQSRIARLLLQRQVEEVALTPGFARAIGLLIGRCGHRDVVDVSVALCAKERGHTVVTSDPDDLRAIDPSISLAEL